MLELFPKERIFLLKRRHPIILKWQLYPLYSLFILFLILTLIFIFKEISFPQISKYKLNFILSFFFSLTLPVFWLLSFFLILQYHLTYWVITNRRIIFVRLIGLFNINYVSVEFDKIQDITTSIKGFSASIFHYGDVLIQTAGEKGQFILDKIEDPQIVQKIIFEAKADFQKNL